MEVIEFPGAEHLNKKLPKIKKEKIPALPQNNLIIDGASFTCPKCSNKTNINFEGMIFRSIDFHCGKCGTRHRFSNPAFSKQISNTSASNKHTK